MEPYDRVMTAFNLSENLKELDDAGFWVFVPVHIGHIAARRHPHSRPLPAPPIDFPVLP